MMRSSKAGIHQVKYTYSLVRVILQIPNRWNLQLATKTELWPPWRPAFCAFNIILILNQLHWKGKRQ